MTVPTNTYQTYQAIGNREDLIDVITTISPMETWFTSNTGATRAMQTLHEWQTDVLAAAAANLQIEGDDATATAAAPTTRLGNYTQILWKVFQVSETQRAVVSAGRTDEVDYQTMKRTKELARDIEYALLINSTTAAGSASVARQMKGVLGWVATNLTTATATSQALDEATYNGNLALVWAQGGYPSVTLVGSYQKRKISGFTSNTRRIEAEEKKLVNTVDVYESDFGTIMVRLHHVMNDTQPGYILNLGSMELWVKAWLRPVNRIELAKTGSSDRYKIEAELTLECRNEKGSGLMTGFFQA